MHALFRRGGCGAMGVAFAVSMSLAGQLRPRVPVLVGGSEGDEGCAGTATVTIREGSILNLRSGPSTADPVLAQLPLGQVVSICQRGPGGWAGVVVHGSTVGARDCAMSDAGSQPKPYAGPCNSGWVAKRFLRIMAG